MKNSPTFTAAWIGLAQAYHKTEVRMRRHLLGYKTEEVRELDTEKALALGADMVGEFTVLAIALGAVYYDWSRYCFIRSFFFFSKLLNPLSLFFLILNRSRQKELAKDAKQEARFQTLASAVDVLSESVTDLRLENDKLREEVEIFRSRGHPDPAASGQMSHELSERLVSSPQQSQDQPVAEKKRRSWAFGWL